MKRSLKSILGVTLLEIMLVLAIAAMIIIMSIRFYQSSLEAKKVQEAVSTASAIMAGANSWYDSKGTFSGYGTAQAAGYMPDGLAPKSPWSSSTISITGTASNYTIQFSNVPNGSCTQIGTLLSGNPKVTAASCTSIVVTQ